MQKQSSRLKRERHRMPGFVRQALTRERLMEAYKSRPPYQQNDYVGWIIRAKLLETQEKRLAQMLEELARGDRSYKPKDKQKKITEV